MTPSCPACGGRQLTSTPWSAFRWREFRYGFLDCRACGTWFVDPMPGSDIAAELYSPLYVDTHYAECASGSDRRGEGRTELLDVVDEVMRMRPGSTWLDVGCGVGDLLRVVASRGGRAEGYEPNAASADATMARTGLRVHHGSLDDLPSDFDVAHAADVLEHVAEPLDLLRAIAGRVGPEGLVVLRGPLEAQRNLFRLLVVARSAMASRMRRTTGPTDMPPYHVVLFSLEGWNRLLARAGLTVLHQRVYETHWPAPETPTLTLVSLAKELSIRVSRSRLGRAWGFGSRVVTIARHSPP